MSDIVDRVDALAPAPLERSSSSAEIDELRRRPTPEQPPSPDSSTGLEAPLLPLEVADDDVKLERMETGDGVAAPGRRLARRRSRGPSAGSRSWPSRRCWRRSSSPRSPPASCWPKTRARLRAPHWLAARSGATVDGPGPPRGLPGRDADAFVMYTFLQLGLVLALCFLSVASLTIAANGRVSATVRFHRASVGCACLVQLLTSSATTYSSFGVHALFAA